MWEEWELEDDDSDDEPESDRSAALHDAEDAFVIFCGNPDCIMPLGHYLSECVTAAEVSESQKDERNEEYG